MVEKGGLSLLSSSLVDTSLFLRLVGADASA